MVETVVGTPREDGFRMPGEFELHQGCWLLWPLPLLLCAAAILLRGRAVLL